MPETEYGITWDYPDDGDKIAKREGRFGSKEVNVSKIFEVRGPAPTGNAEILAMSRVYGKGNHRPAGSETELEARRIEYRLRTEDDDVADPEESGMTLPEGVGDDG